MILNLHFKDIKILQNIAKDLQNIIILYLANSSLKGIPVIVQISKFFSQDTELKWENNSHDVILRFSTAVAQIAALRKN